MEQPSFHGLSRHQRIYLSMMYHSMRRTCLIKWPLILIPILIPMTMYYACLCMFIYVYIYIYIYNIYIYNIYNIYIYIYIYIYIESQIFEELQRNSPEA